MMKVVMGIVIIFVGLLMIIVSQLINANGINISNDTFWIMRTLLGGQGFIVISIGMYSFGSGMYSNEKN